TPPMSVGPMSTRSDGCAACAPTRTTAAATMLMLSTAASITNNTRDLIVPPPGALRVRIRATFGSEIKLHAEPRVPRIQNRLRRPPHRVREILGDHGIGVERIEHIDGGDGLGP